MRKNHVRADYVPAAPVRKALQEWLRENDSVERGGSDRNIKNYYSPLDVLAERMGMAKDTVWHHVSGNRDRPFMVFDVADAFLCAADRPQRWWQDPELAEHYERACKGADSIYPLQAAA